jgi:hypothetical protein
MPLPSLYLSHDKAREWNVARAALYGAALGLLAGLFKTFGPLHHGVWSALEIAGATVGFAALCAAAAAIRNVVARRQIWPGL